MKQIRPLRWLLYALVALGAVSLATRANASGGDFYQSYTQARVIARLPLSGGGATRMFLRQEGKTRYLYVQRDSQQGFTVVDVTKPGRPRLIRRMPLETLTVMGSGLMVTETLDHSTAPTPSGVDRGDGDHQGDAVPEKVHVLEISDPVRSRMAPILNGVSSILQDPARNLTYMVNDEGVWILSRQQVMRHQCGSSDAISPIPNCN
jgi:hypothetical protein